MSEDMPLPLILLLMVFYLFFAVYVARNGWRFLKKGIYTPSFLEKWVLGFLSAVKGQEAAEQHRRRLQSPNRKRFESYMNLVVGSLMVLVLVIGAILALAIQLT